MTRKVVTVAIVFAQTAKMPLCLCDLCVLELFKYREKFVA